MKSLIDAVLALFRNSRKSSTRHSLRLLVCQIHGSHYYDCLHLVKRKDLKKGEQLCLLREPNNSYDSHAIEIYNTDNIKLGYVPKNHNLVIAHLMDQGAEVSVYITAVDEYAWEPVTVEITLRV